jgi:hypothetical protein
LIVLLVYNSYLDFLDLSVLDVNSIDPKQLARMRQQRTHEQKRRELERYIQIFSSISFFSEELLSVSKY